MSKKFKPTHVIVCRDRDVKFAIPVRKSPSDTGASLYQKVEWLTLDVSDWTLEADGRILFQGAVPVGFEYELVRIKY